MGLFEMIASPHGRTRTWRLCAAQLATLAFDMHPAVRSNFGEPRFVNIVKGAA
jgi:hypothetical protein